MLITSNFNFSKYNLNIQAPVFKAKAPQVTKEQMETLVRQKITVAEICESLKITASNYYRLLKKFGIKTPHIENNESIASITKEQLQDLISSGKKHEEILANLGISTTTYSSLLAKFQIVTDFQSSRANIAGITKEVLQNFVDSGKKVKAICQELQIPERTYSRLLDKFGILTGRKLAKAHIASITREQLLALVEGGLTKDEICQELKIQNYAFYKLLKRFNIPYNYLHHANEVVISKQKLEELFQSGKTTAEIAQELGIAVTTLHEKAKILKVKTEYRDSIDKIGSIPIEEFQSCLDSGMTIQQICTKFNITNAMYSAIIRKYSLVTSQRKSLVNISMIKKETLLNMRKSGKSIKEICSELNISQSTYRRILNKA